jgi:hypothetical protein
MITESQYLGAKKIVEQYEEQLKLSLIVWICTKNLYMNGTKDKVFTKGREYKQIVRNYEQVIDDEGEAHSIGGTWLKYFTPKL